jgi:hypothetical protein
MKKHIVNRADRHPESRTLPGEGRSFLIETAAPGMFAGLVGGGVMALLYMGLSAAGGQGFWTLPKMIAGIFWRDLPTVFMPAEAVLVGLFIHFSVAVGVGITWALVVPRSRGASTAILPLSILFGFLVYVVMNYFMVEFMSPPMRRELMQLPWLIAHVIFGMTLALVVPLRATRWVARHRAREIPVRSY